MEKLRDIYGFDHVSFFKMGTFLTVSIGTIILLCAVIAGVIYVHRKKKKLPYWQEALIELERLLSVTHMSSVNKEHFFIVSRIIKNYCSLRYHQYLDAQTDNEFISSVEPLMEPQVHTDVRAIFTDATQVKYAGIASQQQLLRDLIKKAERVIECTREKEEPNKA